MSTKLAKILADFTTSLATALIVGGTSATLQSATDDDGVALPAGVYFFTLDGGNSNKEHIVCTLSGTSITGISSVSRQGVETSGVARAHRLGCTVSITDFGHIKFMNDLLKGDTLFDASTPLGYDGAPTLVGANQFATLQYVLDHVNGGTVSINQIVLAGTAGETFSAGAPVYFKTSDSRWYKILANDTQLNSLTNLQIGIANGAGSAGVAITGGVAISGLVSGLSGLTANTFYYLSDTGTLATSAGTYSVPMGWAPSTTTLILNPNNKLSPNDKGALAGDAGTPSGTNKFLTQSNNFATFGGTGADGALDTTSGTVNIDCGNANVVIKNYTTITIATNNLTFTNPASDGTIIILKATGNVTISATIDVRLMGAAGGASKVGAGNGNDGTIAAGMLDDTILFPNGGAGNGSQGLGGTAKYRQSYPTTAFLLATKGFNLVPGSGGGSGTGFASGTSGKGGRGGGALLIQCGGALNFSGTINSSGEAGGDATGGLNTNAGGGGGSCGMVVIVYNTLTANSGTITATGGQGGLGTGNGQAGGGAASVKANGTAGSAAGIAATLGAGAGGISNGGGSNPAGGASIGGLVVAKTSLFK